MLQLRYMKRNGAKRIAPALKIALKSLLIGKTVLDFEP